MASAEFCKGSLNGGSSVDTNSEPTTGIDNTSNRPAPPAISARSMRGLARGKYKPASTRRTEASGGGSQGRERCRVHGVSALVSTRGGGKAAERVVFISGAGASLTVK